MARLGGFPPCATLAALGILAVLGSAAPAAADDKITLDNLYQGMSGQEFVFNGSADSGTLSLNSGGDSRGSFNAAVGGTLNFGGGPAVLEAASGVTGAGTVGFSAGTTSVNGSYVVTGTTAISGGEVDFNSTASSVTIERCRFIGSARLPECALRSVSL